MYIYVYLLMSCIHGTLTGVLSFVESVLVTKLTNAYPNVKLILI